MSVDDNVLAELLDLMGKGNMPEVSDEEINELLKRGVPIALKEQLNLMMGAGQEKVKAWMIKEWLDRAGWSPVQKIAVAKKISFDDKTLRALAAIAAEDGDTIDAVEVLEGEKQGEDAVAESAAEIPAPGGEPALLSEAQGEAQNVPEERE